MVLAMLRAPLPALASWIALAAVVGLACSATPVYPACKTDGACAHAEHHDYCVSGTCVQCRSAIDCGDRERCRGGRCESDPDAPIPPPPVEAGAPPEDPDPPPPRKRRIYYEE